jgi:hypothetical protein
MKLALFFSIVSFAFGTSLIGSDIAALNDVIPSDLLVAASLIPAVVTVALTPTTFLMYNWACGVEDLRNDGVLRNVLKKQREMRFQAALDTLAKICSRLNEV